MSFLKYTILIALLLSLLVGCKKDDDIVMEVIEVIEETTHKDAVYFPLKIGNRWVYDGIYDTRDVMFPGNEYQRYIMDKRVISDTLIDNIKFYKVEAIKTPYETLGDRPDDISTFYEYYTIDKDANLFDYTKQKRYISVLGGDSDYIIKNCSLSDQDLDDMPKDTVFFDLATKHKRLNLNRGYYHRPKCDFIKEIGVVKYRFFLDSSDIIESLLACKIDDIEYGDTFLLHDKKINLINSLSPRIKTIRLNWNKFELGNFDQYELYKKETDNFEIDKGELIYQSNNLSDTGFVDEEVVHGKDYYYKLYVLDEFDNELANSNVVFEKLIYEKIHVGGFLNQVFLKTQARYDDFANHEYTKVEFLEVDGQYGLDSNNLEELCTINSVKKLVIKNFNNLTSVDGLSNITELEFLEISGSSNLTSLEGLKNAKGLKGIVLSGCKVNLLEHLDVSELETLEILSCNVTSLNTFPEMPKLRDLTIRSYGNLTSLDGLSNITELEFLEISDSSNLTSLAGLKNAKGLKGIVFSGCIVNLLDDLDVNELETLKISFCNELTSLDTFPEMTKLKDLSIVSYKNLTSLETLNTLNFEILDISSCDNLSALGDFINVTELKRLQLLGCHKLSMLGDFTNLNKLEDLTVIRCNSLTSLNGLSNIKETNSWSINNNSALRDFCALQNVAQLNPPSEIRIYDNYYNPTIDQIKTGDCKID
ncbi:hypothetical protein D1815_16845 [Aquimarina sp. AD1]|uniref:hypothetical protein n=1 Tax=Aquimarina sp. (strain AD1) TaxID=1714848 RepID=UPI000E473781|nr:hypothetical protein [Aquimarina sp. AD1]AXT57329.1 hypothetical protein D1815_16845 [Aquimarina sp. AD1]RKN09920.1 hypothetical protein D7035_19675 [Aquimarina sp. AD1]